MPPSKNLAKHESGWLLETVKTIVYAVLIALGIRAVAFQPFSIPSGSMIPTLLVGDYLFVSKYSYGYSHFSLPFSPDLFSGRIFGRTPQRGDVVVFRYTRDTSVDYVKRVIGLPGDHVQVRDGQLYINNQLVPRQSAGDYTAQDENGGEMLGREFTEDLPDGPHHLILKLTEEQTRANDTPDFEVPAGYLFMMGDNRDNSADSRFMDDLGFVPMENLIGKAQFIFFSVDAKAPLWEVWEWPFEIRWSRLLKAVT
ncbi:MAG TPA: signal peptidase I [Acetobacteraceae bacterium]|nr:signal peptidase I [Acetobacteraceae bacterium]